MPPKRILRGKFEAWFFVEFWKKLLYQLRALAQESNGKVQVKIALELSSFVPTLIGYVEVPRSLELFLRAHLSIPSGTAGPGSLQLRRRGFLWKLWNRVLGAWSR